MISTLAYINRFFFSHIWSRRLFLLSSCPVFLAGCISNEHPAANLNPGYEPPIFMQPIFQTPYPENEAAPTPDEVYQTYGAEAPNLDPGAPASSIKEAPATAISLTPPMISGVWQLYSQNGYCQIATPQTKYQLNYRATPLKCSEPVSNIKSWNIKGKNLYFYDAKGNVFAALYSDLPYKFQGTTLEGSPIILLR